MQGKTVHEHRCVYTVAQREGNRNLLEVSLSVEEGAGEKTYQDIKGFCKSATLAEIEKHNFVLTPGCYVDIPDKEDDGVPFEDKMTALTAESAIFVAI